MYGLHGFAFLSMLAVASASAIPVSIAARDTAIYSRQNTTAAGTNIQTFNTSTPDPFSFPAPEVFYDAAADDGTGNSKAFTEGTQTYNNAITALMQSCNDQQQTCNQASNDGSSGVTTQQCGDQQQKCQQAAQTIGKQYQKKNNKRDGGKFRAAGSKRDAEAEEDDEEEEAED